MAKKQAKSVKKAEVETKVEAKVEAPAENKLPEDETFATPIKPDAEMKAAAAKEDVVNIADLPPKNADSVVEGDKPPRKLKKGEVYLGKGSIMVNS